MKYFQKLIFLLFLLIHYANLSILSQTHSVNSSLFIASGQINSITTQLPFGFHHLQLCPSTNELLTDSIGEILSNKRTQRTKFEIKINQNEYCKKLCTTTLTPRQSKKLGWFLSREYKIPFYLDKLPAALARYDSIQNRQIINYNDDIPLGDTLKIDNLEELIIYNHFTFKIEIHEVQKDEFEIVGFSVFPFSTLTNDVEDSQKCEENKDKLFIENSMKIPQRLIPGETNNITFSYDVIFIQSNLTMMSRWDYYKSFNSDIHWYGLINSNLIIVIFTAIVVFIFLRIVKKDIEIYNIKAGDEDFIDEFGWKQVCNDVFRRPIHSMIFSSFVGTGMQLFLMLFLSLFFVALGSSRPESRANIVTFMIGLFVLMGFFAGYISARLFRIFNGANWLKNSLLTAILYPGLVFTIFFIVNFFYTVERSSSAFRLIDIISLLLVWIFLSTPLVLIGAFFGVKRRVLKLPCRVNQFPSPIPQKPWYFKIKYFIWLTGFVPFG